MGRCHRAETVFHRVLFLLFVRHAHRLQGNLAYGAGSRANPPSSATNVQKLSEFVVTPTSSCLDGEARVFPPTRCTGQGRTFLSLSWMLRRSQPNFPICRVYLTLPPQTATRAELEKDLWQKKASFFEGGLKSWPAPVHRSSTFWATTFLALATSNKHTCA